MQRDQLMKPMKPMKAIDLTVVPALRPLESSRAAAIPTASDRCRAPWDRILGAWPTAGTALHGSVMTCAWRWRVAIGVAARHLLLEESAHTT